MRRFRLKVTPTDLKRLDMAYDMAKYGHRNQFRESGERYFEHVRNTAIILVDELGVYDVELIMAALLHDILEDSFLLKGDRTEMIFGARVAYITTTVSKLPKDDPRFATPKQRLLFYHQQIKNGNWEVKLVKLADRLHNLRTLMSCSLEKQKRKLAETKRSYLPLVRDLSSDYRETAKQLETAFRQAIATVQKSIASAW
ncbi:MAG: HD domain-containing protein [Candidatus Paceibacterota bacterium]